MPDTTVFLPTFGNRPARLIGRDSVIEAFHKGLSHQVGHPDRATLLIGQRGMGKTALLLEFAECAEKEGFVVARVTATTAMLDDILGAIQRKGARLV
jgi:predicted AAA+ superfamily ATPase